MEKRRSLRLSSPQACSPRPRALQRYRKGSRGAGVTRHIVAARTISPLAVRAIEPLVSTHAPSAMGNRCAKTSARGDASARQHVITNRVRTVCVPRLCAVPLKATFAPGRASPRLVASIVSIGSGDPSTSAARSPSGTMSGARVRGARPLRHAR